LKSYPVIVFSQLAYFYPSLHSFDHPVLALEDNQALQHERDKDQVELSALRDQVGELRSFLKENRINLDAMKEEKQDVSSRSLGI
jgi:hypothetical protein